MRTCKVCNQEKPLDKEHFGGSTTKGKFYFRWSCRGCELARSRQYYAENLDAQRERVKRYHLETKHGLGEGGYDRLLKQQGGVCGICGTDNPGSGLKYFAVDHDHACCNEKFGCGDCVRGLLCASCNNGLGRFSDSIERLESAIEYLRMVHYRSARPVS